MECIAPSSRPPIRSEYDSLWSLTAAANIMPETAMAGPSRGQTSAGEGAATDVGGGRSTQQGVLDMKVGKQHLRSHFCFKIPLSWSSCKSR